MSVLPVTVTPAGAPIREKAIGVVPEAVRGRLPPVPATTERLAALVMVGATFVVNVAETIAESPPRFVATKYTVYWVLGVNVPPGDVILENIVAAEKLKLSKNSAPVPVLISAALGAGSLARQVAT